MRRASDDALTLPIFPHAYLPDGETRLHSHIDESTVLQWHLASIGQTLSFAWKHPLYVKDPTFDRWLYARFSTSVPDTDLTARSSPLFDTAYSYHKCKQSAVQFDAALDYPGCATPVAGNTYSKKDQNAPYAWSPNNFVDVNEGVLPRSADALSADDFFIDLNLLLGTPSPILDSNGAGSWQAYEYPSLGDVSSTSPNCTGTYADPGTVVFLWSWGFWSGTVPYVSHTELGYTPIEIGAQGKWLAEYGVTRDGSVLPAFAFSMMPKMVTVISPTGIGSGFPFSLMGAITDSKNEMSALLGGNEITFSTTGDDLWGHGCLLYLTYFGAGYYTLYLYCGIYFFVFAILVTIPTAIYRFKVDQS